MTLEEHLLRIEHLEILSSGDVAVLLGRSLKTVQNWTSEGRIPHYKSPDGGSNFFRKKEVIEWATALHYEAI